MINSGYQGYVTLDSTNFIGAESAGFMNFIVDRTSGSQGTVSVQYSTTNGTAVSGVDYIGTTNRQLLWDSGDVAPRSSPFR